ncbi:MAG: hypothetical protein WCE23_06140 [Candidatus Binatus sp.]|uniref:hypothetical protein n=1 Tax=Candidatus Binatus sp. TaxID=2811406 RepID=UPI003C7659AA
MTDAAPQSATPQTVVERAPNFTNFYANNIYYESTAWDMKFTFGHVDQATAPVVVKNDIAVTIPWPQAKLALFWLRLHVELAEAEVGVKIPIRKDLLPAELPENFPEPAQESDPKLKLFRDVYNKLRAEFLTTV